MVEIDAKYTPSSIRLAHTWAGARSQNRGERSSPSRTSTSAADRALAAAGRGGGGPSLGGAARR
jgi:hypothetical protein